MISNIISINFMQYYFIIIFESAFFLIIKADFFCEFIQYLAYTKFHSLIFVKQPFYLVRNLQFTNERLRHRAICFAISSLDE